MRIVHYGFISRGFRFKMSPSDVASGLYGLKNSSRAGEFWTKNKFNSAFPAALACYMRDESLPATYVCFDDSGQLVNSDLPINDLFGSTLANSELFFRFEGAFDAYSSFQLDKGDRVDLIVSKAIANAGGHAEEGEQLRALEVKLTVVPDNATCRKTEKNWGSEIVLRPSTTQYCMMSMAQSCAEEQVRIRQLFEPSLGSVVGWGNEVEAKGVLLDALDCLESFENEFYQKQTPLILQPIWKTKGKSPDLDDRAFDLFVWSDFAYARLIRDQAKNAKTEGKISRPARACLRLARALLEFGRHGKPHMKNIKDEMSYGMQNDKELSVNGGVVRQYITSERIYNPRIAASKIDDIVLGDGASKLSPERRLDQTIVLRNLGLLSES